MDNKNNNDNEDIEVVIGDSSEIKFSEVSDFVEELKPKTQKKSNIIIPHIKRKEKSEKKDKKKF